MGGGGGEGEGEGEDMSETEVQYSTLCSIKCIYSIHVDHIITLASFPGNLHLRIQGIYMYLHCVFL